MNSERRRLARVNENWDAAIGVETKVPVFLLHVRHDVQDCGRPFQIRIYVFQFL